MYQFHFTRENSLVALPGIWGLCLDLQHDWDFWLQGYFIAIDHELSIHQGTKIGQEVSIKECVPLNRLWKCTTPKAPQSNLWQCTSAISSNWQTETSLKAVTQIEIDHWWGLGRGSNLDGPLGALLLFYLWERGEPNAWYLSSLEESLSLFPDYAQELHLGSWFLNLIYINDPVILLHVGKDGI